MERAAAGLCGLAGRHSAVLVFGLRQRGVFVGHRSMPPVRKGGTKWEIVNTPAQGVPRWQTLPGAKIRIVKSGKVGFCGDGQRFMPTAAGI